MASLGNRCPVCVEDDQCYSSSQLKNHNLEYHSSKFKVTLRNGMRLKLYRGDDGKCSCPFCEKAFITKRQTRQHLRYNCGDGNNDHGDDNNDQGGDDNDQADDNNDHGDDNNDQGDDHNDQGDDNNDQGDGNYSVNNNEDELGNGGERIIETDGNIRINNGDEVYPSLPPVTISESLQLPKLPASGLGKRELELDHDTAVSSALGVTDGSFAEKTKTLLMVDAFELRPFTLCNQHGRLYHAVAHSRVVEQLTIGPVTVTSTDITPFKRQRVECESCRPAACPGLENLFNVSPYVATLQTRQFIELDDEMCSFLNQDWTFQSSLQYACAQILAGSIFYNPRNGHTVINNTVETYGRTRSVDAHRERITVVKDVLSPSTLPPNTRTCYKNVYPLTYYYSQEGERLALGTQTFNILVTSSLRLDVVEPPSVGGTVGSFQMRSVQDCSVARIFLDMESVQAGLSVAKEGRTSIWPSNLFTQLRQLKTLFHDGSTYRLCRAAGFLTQGHNCQPFTVFTLVDFDGSKSLSAQSGSKLLRTIAASVLESGTSAVLTLDTVKSLRDQCKDSREIRTQFDAIVRLFTGVDTTLLIIGNSSLNAELATLAKKLSSYIDTANKSSVQSSIKMAFPVNSPPQK